MRMNHIVISIILLLLVDLYVFFGVRSAYLNGSENSAVFTRIYWVFAIALYVATVWTLTAGGQKMAEGIHRFILVVVFLLLAGKLIFSVFLLLDDVTRAIRWLWSFFELPSSPAPGSGISRLQFIVSGGLFMGTGFVAALSYGIIRGAHDYRVVRQRVRLPGLPASFEGMKLVQISDIHSGSFWNKRSVMRGIRMVNELKADMVFFTGDLVNNLSSEMDEYKDLFKEIQAPLGVYSVLGNHDYAEYIPELTPEERQKSIDEVIETHRYMGWDILLNEHRIIEKNGEKIGVIGIENWSAHSRFPKYGRLHDAYKGTENLPVKLLLSHDPSHWRAQVLKEYPDIDITFSGHTHGMQFGLETGGFKWSPVKYLYPEWAGMYQQGDQFLYVNRGFGFLGYPGRLGIRPEITVFEFERS